MNKAVLVILIVLAIICCLLIFGCKEAQSSKIRGIKSTESLNPNGDIRFDYWELNSDNFHTYAQLHGQVKLIGEMIESEGIRITFEYLGYLPYQPTEQCIPPYPIMKKIGIPKKIYTDANGVADYYSDTNSWYEEDVCCNHYYKIYVKKDADYWLSGVQFIQEKSKSFWEQPYGAYHSSFQGFEADGELPDNVEDDAYAFSIYFNPYGATETIEITR